MYCPPTMFYAPEFYSWLYFLIALCVHITFPLLNYIFFEIRDNVSNIYSFAFSAFIMRLKNLKWV